MLYLQNTILEMIARGEALKPTVDRLCTEIERLLDGALCSVLTVDGDGKLHPLSGPSLPAEYSSALDNVPTGPTMGSCGTAAYFAAPVVVTDIATDPLWDDFRNLALPLGLLACWSSPICDAKGAVLGTFALYYREKRGPTSREKTIVNTCIHLCAIAMERNSRQLEHSRLAYTDALTGLPNRAGFNAAISRLSYDQPNGWALLLIDLDNLKTVNDTFGHYAGDCLIQAVASRIAQAVHPGKAFRIGGDEFAVIVRTLGPDREMESVAQSILEALNASVQCAGHVIIPKATIGGAGLTDGDESSDAIRLKADLALYHAKETHRGGFVRYAPGLGTSITRRLSAIRMVETALNDDRIHAHYQPIVRLDTREIVGVEALCRLRALDGRLVPAAEFQEATADVNVASELTRQMLGKVAADVRRWLDMGIPFQRVGVNVSSADFHGGRLSDQLAYAFDREGVPLRHVVIEVNESVYVGQDQSVTSEIERMQAQGLRMALDDFGTGFASLTHLLTMPIDIIKIDKSFVDSLASDNGSSAIIEGLVGIARKLDIRVVIEGIETAEQADQLIKLGCLLGQGYHYSRAVDRLAITELLLHNSEKPDLLGQLSPLVKTAVGWR